MKYLESKSLRVVMSAILLAILICSVSMVLAWDENLVQNYKPRNPITGSVQIEIWKYNKDRFAICILGFKASSGV